MKLTGGGGIRKSFGNAESTLTDIQEIIFTKVEAYACTEERLVRGLMIEEAIQTEIKDTLEHNKQ